MSKGIGLANGQRIQICPQDDSSLRCSARQARYHARATQAPHNLIADILKLTRDDIRRSVLFKAQLGMGMQVASQFRPVRMMLS
ncbi:hypothetical protein LMG19083_00638 [Ralstonia psammae]|uniref:Uncharacterized protein n=1 Tax=Ralstonia psammae TaxID=3058598 RepID=A0ABM9J2E9_9RALS|nr:hypothetical protein LMG19083_00638 [Ralstonia sp. LMG 19083]CAJ0821989.1 hypothetical protein LMG19087_04624 [Ralstonia wenshanensis]